MRLSLRQRRILIAAGVWALTLTAFFVALEPLDRMGAVLAALLGMIVLPLVRWAGRGRALATLGLALVLSLTLVWLHLEVRNSRTLTRTIGDERRVLYLGAPDRMTQGARNYVQGERKKGVEVTTEQLLEDFGWDETEVWTEASLNRIRQWVLWSYVLCIPFLAASLLAAVQLATSYMLSPVASAAVARRQDDEAKEEGADAAEGHRIFFSYTRRDAEFCLQLAQDLERRGLAGAWIDQLDIGEGRWDTKVERALREAAAVVVVLSPDSVKSQNVLDEVGYAIDHGLPLFPVLYRPCELPLRLRRLQFIDFSEYDEGLEQLVPRLKHRVEALGGEILSLTSEGPGPAPELPGAAPAVIAPAMEKLPTWVKAVASSSAAPAAASCPAPVPPPAAQVQAVDDDFVQSLVVLPVRDLSTERDQEYFCAGMAEDLITALTRIEGLRVASRSSIHQLKGEAGDPRAIGARFGVEAVLGSSLRKAGNRLRINVELTKAADGFQLWAERYDRELEDIFQIQAEIAESVAGSLKLRVSGRNGRGPTKLSAAELEAHELYVKGRHLWNQRTEESLKKSLQLFHDAVRAAPGYAQAHQGLASACATLGLYGAEPPGEVMPRAREAARHALELDPALSEAHAALGCVQAIYEWSWREAELSFRRAIELDADNAPALQWFAINHLVPLGRFEEAESWLDRALGLDPLSPAVSASRGLLYYFGGRHERAVDELQKTLDFQPGFVFAHLFLSQALTELGRHDEAAKELELAGRLARHETPEMIAMRAYSQARAGDPIRGHEALGTLADLAARRYVSPSLLAVVFMGIGDHESALGRLVEAVENRSSDIAWLAVRPVYRDLRGESGFHPLLEKMGLGGTPTAS